jgi:hypothetical protein
MPRSVEPLLHPFAITALRPTQMTVGYREVARKRGEWRARTLADEPDFLGRHMIPVVLGPRGHPWLIDNHHLARALYEEGVKHVLVNIVADLSGLERPAFRTFMDNRNWLHPFDAQGQRQPYGAIPKHIKQLADDPYRSLAGELRRAGGYAKDSMPYAEFLWADYLRRHIGTAMVARDFATAVTAALQLAHVPQASYLPGWAGPED